jgi:hypothetical protein
MAAFLAALGALIPVAAALFSLSLAILVAIFVKRCWFSSISDIPGPFLGSFSVLWQIWNSIKGHTEAETIALHRKHGWSIKGYPAPGTTQANIVSQVTSYELPTMK